VVVTPEYRLCPQVSLYDGPIQDAKDVLRWCQHELPGLLENANVQVDSSRIVAMGHSAGGQLALTTGLCANPPLAIVDFYGCKQFADPFWIKPSPPFAQVPQQSEVHIAKVFEGPQAVTSLPLFVNGKPALEDPRCAWFITQLRDGKSISSIVPDGDYQRVDATTQFSSDFPPTYFFHGTTDVFVDLELTARTHKRLREFGVETTLDIGKGVGHVFDLALQETDPLFIQHVVPALDFLQKHV
jgi:acetyl esterase/lipase